MKLIACALYLLSPSNPAHSIGEVGSYFEEHGGNCYEYVVRYGRRKIENEILWLIPAEDENCGGVNESK